MSGPLDDASRRFLETQPVGTLTTLRSDGKARSSVVYFTLEGDRIRISTVAKRAKARDVTRTGWASFCVMGHEKPFPSLSVEGPARIVTRDIGPATAALLEKITGKTPDAVPTDEQLAVGGRVILEIDVERVYGVSYVS